MLFNDALIYVLLVAKYLMKLDLNDTYYCLAHEYDTRYERKMTTSLLLL